MLRKLAVIVALMALMALTGSVTGCLAKQAVFTVAGPQGDYALNAQGADASQLQTYRAVEVARFENEIPGRIDEALVQAVQADIVKELKKCAFLSTVTPVASMRQRPVDTPTIVVTGRLLDATSDRFPGEKLIFGGNYLIARVRMLDKETGRMLVDGNVRGVVHSALDTNPESPARGIGKGTRKMVEKFVRPTEEKKPAEAPKDQEQEKK